MASQVPKQDWQVIVEVAEALSHMNLPKLAARLWISAGASDFTFFGKASRPSRGLTPLAEAAECFRRCGDQNMMVNCFIKAKDCPAQ